MTFLRIEKTCHILGNIFAKHIYRYRYRYRYLYIDIYIDIVILFQIHKNL